MRKGNANEASRAASQARKEKESMKKQKGKHDTDSSSDSNDDNATENAAQKIREKERKRRLAAAEADNVITDCMIAEAEARNQAKLAKLAETRASYPVIWVPYFEFRNSNII